MCVRNRVFGPAPTTAQEGLEAAVKERDGNLAKAQQGAITMAEQHALALEECHLALEVAQAEHAAVVEAKESELGACRLELEGQLAELMAAKMAVTATLHETEASLAQLRAGVEAQAAAAKIAEVIGGAFAHEDAQGEFICVGEASRLAGC